MSTFPPLLQLYLVLSWGVTLRRVKSNITVFCSAAAGGNVKSQDVGGRWEKKSLHINCLELSTFLKMLKHLASLLTQRQVVVVGVSIHKRSAWCTLCVVVKNSQVAPPMVSETRPQTRDQSTFQWYSEKGIWPSLRTGAPADSSDPTLFLLALVLSQHSEYMLPSELP